MTFIKGHKTNIGRTCSEETRKKIAVSNTKSLVSLICATCGSSFKRKGYDIRKYCKISCRPIWNKGLKGYRAGENHHWNGRNMSKENSPVWIADRSKLKVYGDDNKDRRSSAYVTWRKQVWLRDNFKCKIANPDCKGRIEAHHILGWKSHPELRYELNNGITLCHFHHPFKREDEKKLSPYFQSLVAEMK